MKMWCDRHNAYFHMEDWHCPHCAEEERVLDGIRERIIGQLLARLPDDDDVEFWNSREEIEKVIRQAVERVTASLSLFDCMFYYDHEKKILDISMIRQLDSIKMWVVVE